MAGHRDMVVFIEQTCYPDRQVGSRRLKLQRRRPERPGILVLLKDLRSDYIQM